VPPGRNGYTPPAAARTAPDAFLQGPESKMARQ
jgi:hypothetical protein